MTTTVYDVEQRVVSSDSRWSIDLTPLGSPGCIAYVDDTGFDKVAERATHILSLAGSSELIGMWKQWWAGDVLTEPQPPVELPGDRKVVLSIINKSTSTVDFDCGPKLAQVCSDTAKMIAVFAGSGSQHAAASWGTSRCPREAVSFAALNDPYTGGEYRFINFASYEHNLGPVVYDVDVIHRELVDRGYIMNIADRKPIKLKDLVDAQRIEAAIIAREIVAQAPVSAQNNFEWTDERKARLDGVIDSIRQAEAKVRAG